MHAGTPSAADRALPRWYEWGVALAVALAAITYLAIKPAAELTAQGVGQALSTAVTGIAAVAGEAHALACQAIETDPQVAMLFGQGFTCAKVEDATWYDTHGRQELEFSFAIYGEQVMQGQARAVASLNQTGMELKSVYVTGPDSTLILPLLR